MNRRGFIASCLAGAVLGVARRLPIPAVVDAKPTPSDIDKSLALIHKMQRQMEEALFYSSVPMKSYIGVDPEELCSVVGFRLSTV